MTSLRASGVRRLNALLRQAREPIFLLDPQGRFVFVNSAWEALTGRPAEFALGRACVTGGDPSANGPGHDGLSASFAPPPEVLAGRPGGGVTLIVHAEGARLRRRVEFWPYHDDKGGLLGLLGLVRPAESAPHAPESESQKARAELSDLREALRDRHGFDDLIGRGPRHERLLGQVANAASSSCPVLIVGEPGTGRTLVARTIHRLGHRPESPLIPLDLPALPPEVLDRELFDDAEADGARSGPTYLLHEALDLPRDLQVKLAEAIRTSRFRVLATTRSDPDLAFRDEALRAEFYFAITHLVIRLAPLRDRLDELPLLAQHLLDRANRRGARRRAGFHAETTEALKKYDWPGNLAEMARVIEAAHGRGPGDLIAPDDLPAAIRGDLASAYAPPPVPPAITPLDQWLTQLERRLIEQALHRARQNKSRAAELLGISRPRLYRRIKELNIPDEPEPSDDSTQPTTAPARPDRPEAEVGAEPGRAEAS